MVNLSIIVVSYNTADLTVACLDSLSVSLKKHPVIAEIIVVDNHSSDDSVKLMKSLEHRDVSFKVIENDSNLGFGKANNIGVKRSSGEFILFLNSDTLVDELDFEGLISLMRKDEKIGALTVRVNLENGDLDPASHRGFPTIWRSFTYFSKLEQITRYIPVLNRVFGGYHLTHLSHKTTHEIDSPSGAFFLTRKVILEEVGGFDEKFFMYGEDLDLAMRIKKLGLKMVFYPKQSIIHLKGKSGMKHKSSSVKGETSKHFYDAMKIFYNKHYSNRYPVLISKIVDRVIDFRIKKRDVGI